MLEELEKLKEIKFDEESIRTFNYIDSGVENYYTRMETETEFKRIKRFTHTMKNNSYEKWYKDTHPLFDFISLHENNEYVTIILQELYKYLLSSEVIRLVRMQVNTDNKESGDFEILNNLLKKLDDKSKANFVFFTIQYIFNEVRNDYMILYDRDVKFYMLAKYIYYIIYKIQEIDKKIIKIKEKNHE